MSKPCRNSGSNLEVKMWWRECNPSGTLRPKRILMLLWVSLLQSRTEKSLPMPPTFDVTGWKGITRRSGHLTPGQTMHHQVYSTCYLLLSFLTYLLVGSGSAEGFHNRLNHNMPRNAMSLDKMVDYLAAEDEYWRRLVNDSRLWTEKKASHASSQDRHRRKRRMLSSYVERGNNEERSDAVISSDLLSSDGDNERIEDNTSDLESISSFSSTTTTTTSSSSMQIHPSPTSKVEGSATFHSTTTSCCCTTSTNNSTFCFWYQRQVGEGYSSKRRGLYLLWPWHQ